MSDERCVVAVVCEDAELQARITACLEGAQAFVEPCSEADASTKAAAGLDGIVFAVGTEPERFRSVAALLRMDATSKEAPSVIVTGAEVGASRLEGFGPASIVTTESALEEALVDLVERARARFRVVQAAGEAERRSRGVQRRIAEVKKQAATLSHDARVLFGVIVGFGSNLRDGFAGALTDAQQKSVANILEAATDAAALVERHAAALQKVEDDDSVAPPSSSHVRGASRRGLVDIGELVRSTVGLFEGIAAGKRIALSSVTPSVTAWCDAVFVKQALVNLVANALKFTPEGGAVRVEVRSRKPREARGRDARATVEILVLDTGPGIPADDRERIFERGVRLPQSEGSPGSGLGLAVVRDVATMHHGSVWVDDNPEGGSIFHLSLPTDARSRREASGDSE